MSAPRLELIGLSKSYPGVLANDRVNLRVRPALAQSRSLVDALQRHASDVFGESIPVCGTPLYTDARLYAEHGIAAAIYGAGPRTVRESNAKRADEHLVLDDLRRATKVIARTLVSLLS